MDVELLFKMRRFLEGILPFEKKNRCLSTPDIQLKVDEGETTRKGKS